MYIISVHKNHRKYGYLSSIWYSLKYKRNISKILLAFLYDGINSVVHKDVKFAKKFKKRCTAEKKVTKLKRKYPELDFVLEVEE